MTGISKNVPATSDYSPKTTEDVRRCCDDFRTRPKLFEAFPMAFERIEDV